jgi:DTW domain-containing protein YfiP
MSQRRRLKPRCAGCGLTPALCACALLPTVRLSTRIVVVQHVREIMKPTNTARLLARMVEGTALVPWGMREPPFDPSRLRDPAIDIRVLFPREDAPVLSLDPPAADRARGIVLLDGTWHQCTRMTRRVEVVRDLPCVALPAGPPSVWGVRTQHDERGLSTFEAGLRVLELLEGSDAVAPLRRGFEVIVARMLFMKGKRSTWTLADEPT